MLVCETTHAGTGYRAEWSDGTNDFDGVRPWPSGKGTSIRIGPDPSIFDDGFPGEELERRLNDFAGLIPGLRVRYADRTWLPLTLDRSLGRLLPGSDAWRQPPVIEHRGMVDGLKFEVNSLVRRSKEPSGQFKCYLNYREVTQRCALTDQIHRSFTTALGSGPFLFGNLDVVVSLLLPGASYSGPTRSAVEDPAALLAVEQALVAELPTVVTALHDST